MAGRGTKAKEEVVAKLVTAFGEDFIGEIDKKIYLWADDGGEKVQIALTLTCPKVLVDIPKVDKERGKRAQLGFVEDYIITKEEEDYVKSLIDEFNL